MKNTVKLLSILVIFLGVSFSTLAEEGSDKNAVKETTANSTMTGKVLDTVTGEALAGVKVEIPGTKLSTYTDFDGNFSFENIGPGTYNISTSLISYNKTTFKEIDVTAGKNQALKINLKPLTE